MRPVLLALSFGMACAPGCADGYEWTFLDGIDEGDTRGVSDHGAEKVCQATTAETAPSQLVVRFPTETVFQDDSRLVIAVYEANPYYFESPARCIDGGVFEIDSPSFDRFFRISTDIDHLQHFTLMWADIDGNYELLDDEVDFSGNSSMIANGSVEVTMYRRRAPD